MGIKKRVGLPFMIEVKEIEWGRKKQASVAKITFLSLQSYSLKPGEVIPGRADPHSTYDFPKISPKMD